MSCGCSNSQRCGCSSCRTTASCGCPTVDNCVEVCTALEVANAWNIPACDAEAVLSVPGLETVLIGSYLYNPTYGSFLVTAFDSVNHQLTVLNPCFDSNAVAGTVVPAGTTFIFGAPPSSTNITYSGGASGTPYTLTNASAHVVFGTTSPDIILTVPGTYLLIGSITFAANNATTAGPTSFVALLRRSNNTPADVTGQIGLAGTPTLTAYTNFISTATIYPVIYTTLNSNDAIQLNAYYSAAAPSAGSFQASNASLTAIKLS